MIILTPRIILEGSLSNGDKAYSCTDTAMCSYTLAAYRHSRRSSVCLSSGYLSNTYSVSGPNNETCRSYISARTGGL